jgi:hypothetical protein
MTAPLIVCLIAFIACGCTPENKAQKPIIFGGKNFYDPGKNADFIAAGGTLTGPDIAYPNNSTLIVCYADRRECITYSVEQIGSNQVGTLQLPLIFPVEKWDDREIVVVGDGDAFECSKLTITIARKSESVLWVYEPRNQTRPECKNAPTAVRKYTLGCSSAWSEITQNHDRRCN